MTTCPIPYGPAFEIQVDADLAHAVTWRLTQLRIPFAIDDVVDGWTPLHLSDQHLDTVRSLAAHFAAQRRLGRADWWKAA